MGQVCSYCAGIHTEAILYPFQKRVYLLRKIEDLLEDENYEEARNIVSLVIQLSVYLFNEY